MKDNLPSERKWKKGDIADLEGLNAKVTFISYETGYVRLELGNFWKAKAQIKDLKVPYVVALP